jgi:hypothetical protein
MNVYQLMRAGGRGEGVAGGRIYERKPVLVPLISFALNSTTILHVVRMDGILKRCTPTLLHSSSICNIVNKKMHPLEKGTFRLQRGVQKGRGNLFMPRSRYYLLCCLPVPREKGDLFCTNKAV